MAFVVVASALATPNDPGAPVARLREWLQPLPRHAILRDPDWHIWGCSMVRTSDGTCHLFVARWPKAHGFNAWVTHSEIAYATATDPTGPYTIHRRLFGGGLDLEPGRWDANAHNAHVIEADGRYFLYYTGNTGDGSWWTHRNNQRIGVAWADQPQGPWHRLDRPIVDVTPGSWDHSVANCPIVARGGDGRFVMIYKGVANGPEPQRGAVRMGLATSAQPLGPWEKQPGNFFDAPGVHFPSDDNFVWYQQDRYLAIVKDYGGNFQSEAREALVMFESRDARSWSLVKPDPVVSLFSIAWADGRRTPHVARFDQPQVWRDEHGQPAVLFVAIKEKGDRDDTDLAYNIAVPLGPLPPIRKH